MRLLWPAEGQGVEASSREERGVVATGPADAVIVGYNPGFDYDRMRVAAGGGAQRRTVDRTNDDAIYPTQTA